MLVLQKLGSPAPYRRRERTAVLGRSVPTSDVVLRQKPLSGRHRISLAVEVLAAVFAILRRGPGLMKALESSLEMLFRLEGSP